MTARPHLALERNSRHMARSASRVGSASTLTLSVVVKRPEVGRNKKEEIKELHPHEELKVSKELSPAQLAFVRHGMSPDYSNSPP